MRPLIREIWVVNGLTCRGLNSKTLAQTRKATSSKKNQVRKSRKVKLGLKLYTLLIICGPKQNQLLLIHCDARTVIWELLKKKSSFSVAKIF